MKHNLNELSHNISPSYRTRHQSSYFNSLFPLTSVSCKVIWAILAESEDVILFISLMLAFLECTSTEYLNQSCNSRLWCVVCIVYCGMRMLDADGSCVGDGSIMNVRIKMNVNVNPYSYSYFVVWGSPICF